MFFLFFHSVRLARKKTNLVDPTHSKVLLLMLLINIFYSICSKITNSVQANGNSLVSALQNCIQHTRQYYHAILSNYELHAASSSSSVLSE